MKKIPKTENSLVLRTDFLDEAAWASICAAILEPAGEFRAYLDFLSDPEYDGLTVEQLLTLVPNDPDHTCLFLVDRTTISHPDHPILAVDLYDEPGLAFRVIPSEMWSVDCNLLVANMNFYEYANAADPDGVYRG